MKVDGPRPPARRAHEGESGIDPELVAAWTAGSITLDEVKRALVEQVLETQLGPDAPAELRAHVRAALVESLASDPFLQDRLRALARE